MNDATQDKLAMAALFAALVEALDERTNGLAASFARRLDETRARLQENEAEHRGVLETLTMTRAMLRDDFDRSEPACVVYAKNWAPEDDRLPSSEKVQLQTLDEAVRFWARLPSFDQTRATIETASGHRFDAKAAAALVRRYKVGTQPL